MSKKLKIVLIILIIVTLIILAYIGCTYCLNGRDNQNNSQVTGMNENNNIILDENNIVENNVIENNVVENNVVDNTVEVENENTVPEETTNTENKEITSNNNSEIESDNDEEKVLNIVKKDWGSTDGVYFKIQAIDSNGNYVVSINDAETTASLAWYTVNPKTGEFTN